MEKKIKCPKHDTGGGPCYCDNESASSSNELLVGEMQADLRAADYLAKVIDEQIKLGNINTRSAIADARLDYGTPYKYKYTR